MLKVAYVHHRPGLGLTVAVETHHPTILLEKAHNVCQEILGSHPWEFNEITFEKSEGDWKVIVEANHVSPINKEVNLCNER